MSGGRKTSTYFPPPEFFTPSPNDPEKRAQDNHLSPQAASCSKESTPKHRFSLDVSPVPLPPTISAGDLDYLSTIAQSDFSEVALVRRRDTNKTIVVKAFSRSSWRSQYLCSAELRVFQGVNSPWIVGFYGLIQVLFRVLVLTYAVHCLKLCAPYVVGVWGSMMLYGQSSQTNLSGMSLV